MIFFPHILDGFGPPLVTEVDVEIGHRDAVRVQEPLKEEIVLERIKAELKPDQVHVKRGLALVMIVGEGMQSQVGTAYTATKAFKDANVNIEMINQGSSEVSLMFGIKENSVDDAVKSLYQAFFNK